MEAAALQVLANQDPGAARSAARVLSQFGSASVRPALEQRLEVLQAVIRQRRHSNRSEEEMRERSRSPRRGDRLAPSIDTQALKKRLRISLWPVTSSPA